jgi:hypothetical protein
MTVISAIDPARDVDFMLVHRVDHRDTVPAPSECEKGRTG